MPTSVISAVISTTQTPLLTGVEKNLHEHIAFVERSTPGRTLFDRFGSACSRLGHIFRQVRQNCSRPAAGVRPRPSDGGGGSVGSLCWVAFCGGARRSAIESRRWVRRSTTRLWASLDDAPRRGIPTAVLE